MSCSTACAQFFCKNKGTTTINTFLAKDHDKQHNHQQAKLVTEGNTHQQLLQTGSSWAI
jgi:hypothetical protein